MTPYCTILLDQVTKSDILAACIQADAALKAGLTQAAAATHAGYLTIGAGAFAIIAAVVGGMSTLKAVSRQINANRDEQARQRRQELKSGVYATAAKALANGLVVIARMANLNIRKQDVLNPYDNSIADLFNVHLVADLATVSKFLDCVVSIGEIHAKLLKQRPFRPDGYYQIDDVIVWTRKCTDALIRLTPLLTSTIAAMRAELDLTIDADEYEKLIRDGLEKTLANSEQLFSELLDSWIDENIRGEATDKTREV